MKSFLMVGQSNMAGRGDIGEVPSIANPLCFMLRCGRWQPMSEPVNPDRRVFPNEQCPRQHVSGVCLAASFADLYAKHFSEEIGLIPCAYGGTSISEWQKGDVLFDNAVMQAKLAMRSSELAGILWHQGESDAESLDDVNHYYYDRLMTVLTDFRSELGNVPVVVGELGDLSLYKNGVAKYRNEVNSLIHKVAQNLPNCEIASSQGLKNRVDNLHFDSKSLRILGERYFEKYLILRGNI